MMQPPDAPRVLVVDDERRIADSLVAILNRSGFVSAAAYSGGHAIQTARSFHPDVLVSDVVMLGLSGIDTAIHIRGLFPQCRILLFSGQAVAKDLLATARKEGHSFEMLPKPVHPVQLLSRLREALRQQP